MGHLNISYSDIVNASAIGGSNPKNINDIYHYALQERDSFKDDRESNVLVIGIDVQRSFMENGELPVSGSFRDVENFTRFIFENIHKIKRIAVSLDTHLPQSIFFPSWWVNKEGEHPSPYTVITVEDVEDKVWLPVCHPHESEQYVKMLKQIGKKDLIIWAYHCIQGTEGAALESQFSNMVYFHSVLKNKEIKVITKGLDPLSEMYGIVKLEFDRYGYQNNELLDEIKNYDKIFIGGEAKSHCVLESVRQIAEHLYPTHPEITSNIYLLEDCMSSIGGFEEATNKSFAELQSKYRVKLVRSVDVVI